MTLLAPGPAFGITDTRPIMWTLAEKGFWVGNNSGAFAGTIDQHGDHFYVRDCFGRYLGDYPSLPAAQQHLSQHLNRGIRS